MNCDLLSSETCSVVMAGFAASVGNSGLKFKTFFHFLNDLVPML